MFNWDDFPTWLCVLFAAVAVVFAGAINALILLALWKYIFGT